MNLNENQLTTLVLDKCFEIHRELGPGLFESVYEKILAFELKREGLMVQEQLGLPVEWKEERIDLGFRIDLKVENKLIIELKSIETILPVHKKQLLTYIRLSKIKLGLLVNFNENLLKDGLHRVVNNL
jgi:GxxExxY protein